MADSYSTEHQNLDKLFSDILAPPRDTDMSAVRTVDDVAPTFSSSAFPQSFPPRGIVGRSKDTFSGSVYHIILDCDFSMRNELWNNTNKSNNIGEIRKLPGMDSRVPVLFDMNDVEKISRRLVYVVSQNGCLGDRKYPIFGTIALRIDLSNVSTNHVTVSKMGNTKNYSAVESATEDLVTYTSAGRSTGYKRGVLSTNALRGAKIVGYKYISTICIPEQLGFALLNLNLKNGEDVREIKKLYDASKTEFSEEVTNVIVPIAPNTPVAPSVPIIQPQAETLLDTGLSTGGSVDYESLYRQEKRRYLQLKEIAAKMGIRH